MNCAFVIFSEFSFARRNLSCTIASWVRNIGDFSFSHLDIAMAPELYCRWKRRSHLLRKITLYSIICIGQYQQALIIKKFDWNVIEIELCHTANNWFDDKTAIGLLHRWISSKIEYIHSSSTVNVEYSVCANDSHNLLLLNFHLFICFVCNCFRISLNHTQITVELVVPSDH